MPAALLDGQPQREEERYGHRKGRESESKNPISLKVRTESCESAIGENVQDKGGQWRKDAGKQYSIFRQYVHYQILLFDFESGSQVTNRFLTLSLVRNAPLGPSWRTSVSGLLSALPETPSAVG